MFGKEAIKLINELEQTQELKPFNEAIFKQVLEEIQSLYEDNLRDVEDLNVTQEERPGNTLVVRHYAINRNKRCLLAYLYHRVRRLRQVRWELGSILPTEISANLINPEVQWFQAYNKSLATFMKSIGEEGLNIVNNVVPPKSLYIEVRCLQNYGKFEFDDGQVVNLKQNTCHLLPRAGCEALIRQGVLEHIGT
ncbi:DNA replication complex GINS protein PSF1 [Copidosoma floridanum]|uniref:DNA replication complex GINS protein PSF1 n=1 Tax=Copidosoma floridanum TaxID=29053 RepID=UPI0006C9C07B|nr:DNA replication complex GINS protein PSF1 [Copidosoma floridanum]